MRFEYDDTRLALWALKHRGPGDEGLLQTLIPTDVGRIIHTVELDLELMRMIRCKLKYAGQQDLVHAVEQIALHDPSILALPEPFQLTLRTKMRECLKVWIND